MTNPLQGIDLLPVQSSNLMAVGYDRIQGILYVQFKNSTVWQYDGVITEDYEAMMAADSIGSHYARVIKKQYTGARVDA